MTASLDNFLDNASYFNPHFRKGSDVDRMDMPEALGNFNPHFRKGSDGNIVHLQFGWNDFNPHFRKGSDILSILKSRA